jgi:hypothetical protein
MGASANAVPSRARSHPSPRRTPESHILFGAETLDPNNWGNANATTDRFTTQLKGRDHAHHQRQGVGPGRTPPVSLRING